MNNAYAYKIKRSNAKVNTTFKIKTMFWWFDGSRWIFHNL